MSSLLSLLIRPRKPFQRPSNFSSVTIGAWSRSLTADVVVMTEVIDMGTATAVPITAVARAHGPAADRRAARRTTDVTTLGDVTGHQDGPALQIAARLSRQEMAKERVCSVHCLLTQQCRNPTQ
jgi:hypothetical protein